MDKETTEIRKEAMQSPSPTCDQEMPGPCPPCPARMANLQDTLHFLEERALGLQHITPILRDQEKELLK